MATFAVINDNVVVNLIVAESLAVAKEATGLLCVEYTTENPAGIGDEFEETPKKKVK